MDIFDYSRAIPEPPGPPDTESRVVFLERWCRACGNAFSSGEPFVSSNHTPFLPCPLVEFVANELKKVFSDDDEIRVVGSHGFPHDEDCDSDDDLFGVKRSIRRTFFNWNPYGLRDDKIYESATIHTDCFNLFRQSCTDGLAVHRLQLAAAWRSPWEGAPKFELAATPDVAGLIRLAARVGNLPQLESMPMELKRMVWLELSAQPSTITRYQSVISLAADSSRQDFIQQASMSIGKVASWERGEGPATEEEDLLPVVRITIDCQGVKRIERLAQKPDLLSQQSDTELYIVESQETLADVEVQFQSGLARLKNLGDEEATYLLPWDTPTPPVVEQLQRQRTRPLDTRVVQFSTIDVSRISGITLFMSWKTHNPSSPKFGPEFTVHAHTLKAPSARPTFDRLSAQDWYGIWCYVPFPSNDQLTFFGVRHAHGIYLQALFRFKKAGDVIVGLQSHRQSNSKDIVWPAGNQLQLICGLSQSGNAVTLDAHPKRSGTIKPPFTSLLSRHLPGFDRRAFMSWAPLEHVACIRLFTDEDAGICRGLLLEYENGAQRSVGECRIGLDVERAYVKPVCLCIGRRLGHRRWRMKARVDRQLEHKHTEDDWQCYEMRGTLTSWYMRGYSELKVVVDDDDDVHDDDDDDVGDEAAWF